LKVVEERQKRTKYVHCGGGAKAGGGGGGEMEEAEGDGIDGKGF